MTPEDAREIAAALLDLSGPRTVFYDAHRAAWADALEALPEPLDWGSQRPGDAPEAIILAAHDIYRVPAGPPAEGADPPPLAIARYPIDDRMRIFSRPGEWSIQTPAVERPLRLVPSSRRMRSLIRAIWDGLPEASKGRNPPIV